MLEQLKQIAPNLKFTVSRDIDEHFVWDGDGPDPEENGYYPFDITVAAAVIAGGELLEEHEYLGGAYFRPDEPIGDVHGYLPQMLEEALDQLSKTLEKLQEERHREQLKLQPKMKDWLLFKACFENCLITQQVQQARHFLSGINCRYRQTLKK